MKINWKFSLQAMCFLFIVSFLILSAVILQGMDKFSISSYDGVVYRLNKHSGQIDILYPSENGLTLIPVGTIPELEGKGRVEGERAAEWLKFFSGVSQHVSNERTREVASRAVRFNQ